MISALAIASSALAILSDDEDDVSAALERSILIGDYRIFGRAIATTPLADVQEIFRALARWANQSRDLDEFAGRAKILFEAWYQSQNVYEGTEGDKFRARSDGFGPRVPSVFFEAYVELENAMRRSIDTRWKPHEAWIPGAESVRLAEFGGSTPYIYNLNEDGTSDLATEKRRKDLERNLKRAKKIGGFPLRGPIEVYEVVNGQEAISWDETRILFFHDITRPYIDLKLRSEFSANIKVTD